MRIRRPMLLAGTLASIALGFALGAQAAPVQHHAVFDLSSDNPQAWEIVVRQMENVQKHFGPENSQLELVAHGGGLGMLRSTNTSLASRMQALSEQNVVFAACENTMRRKNITKADLFPFVTPVPAGLAELILKQEAGWAYLKVGL